jgi:hypothetical protein
MNDGRPGETEVERADRNFGELLQELRVAQTGVQILFAFLLTIPFAARFEALDDFERRVLLCALVFSTVATACLIAPVAYHRLLFRRRMKDHIVDATNRYAIAGLAFLVLALTSALLVALSELLPRWEAVALAAVLGLLFLVLWVVLPLLRRARLDT